MSSEFNIGVEYRDGKKFVYLQKNSKYTDVSVLEETARELGAGISDRDGTLHNWHELVRKVDIDKATEDIEDYRRHRDECEKIYGKGNAFSSDYNKWMHKAETRLKEAKNREFDFGHYLSY